MTWKTTIRQWLCRHSEKSETAIDYVAGHRLFTCARCTKTLTVRFGEQP